MLQHRKQRTKQMIIIDILTIILLALAIFYGYGLNKNIRELQKGKMEFSKMLKEFDNAIIRAETSVNDLTRLTTDTNNKLHNLLNQGQKLDDELAFLTDMGTDIAKRLEESISKAQFLMKKDIGIKDIAPSAHDYDQAHDAILSILPNKDTIKNRYTEDKAYYRKDYIKS
jgi:hypothetical protein